MTGPVAQPPPTPAMMPKRRPVIPPPPRRLQPSRFAVAGDMPRRGWPDAVSWPDTGIFLVLGSDAHLPEQFRRHFRGRVRVANGVAREVRGHARTSPPADAAPREHHRYDAASNAVRELLVADRTLPIVELEEDDLAAVDLVMAQLKALEAEPTKRHAGEAQIIVLAEKAARSHPTQVVLTNDGGASVVAQKHGLRSRHAGDVLAEMACANPDMDAGELWSVFSHCVTFTAPPSHARPTSDQDLRCRRQQDSCPTCDEVERSTT